MFDITPWDGIVPILNDLWVAVGVGVYFLGRKHGRKSKSTSLVKV
jgi:hypothetical protein